MLTQILNDMYDIVMRVFGGADTVSLIIMLLVVVLFGLMLRSFGDVITLTVSALIVYGLARLAWSVYQGADPGSLAGTAWGNLKVMSVGDLVVYFLAFAIVMGIVSILRSVAGGAGGGGGGGHGHH